MLSNTGKSQNLSRRSSIGYYMSDSGLLTYAPPYITRPSFTYDSSTSKTTYNGFLDEGSLVNQNTTTYDQYYSSQVNYSQPSDSWSVETTTDIGPTGETETVYKITVPVNTSSNEWKIPVGSGLNRMPSNSSPCWSFYIKNISVPSGTILQLGVPGQSAEEFDMYNLNWTSSVLSSISASGGYAWSIYAGREEYSNGWVRIGLGGYCWASQYVYNAAFDITSSNATQTEEITFYICRDNATYEPTTNMLSSYIPLNSTRSSDDLTTEQYYLNDNPSVTTYVNESGNLVICEPNTVRPNYSYSSTSSTWVQDGNISESSIVILDYGIAEGLQLQSGSDATFGPTTDVLDPTGSSNAYIMTSKSSVGLQSTIVQVLGNIACTSIFVKAGTASSVTLAWESVSTRTFNLSTGEFTDSYTGNDSYSVAIDPIKLSNGWWRLAVGMNDPGDTRDTYFFISSAVGTIYLYGLNITSESKTNYVSSYVPYKGTRSADNIITIPSSTYAYETTSPYTIRDTTATYYDYDGAIQTAPAYSVRPNYTYSSSSWTRNGYLSEKESYNYSTNDLFQQKESYGLVSYLTSINNYDTPFGTQTVRQLNMSTNNFISTEAATLPSWADGLIFSCYLKYISGGTSITSWGGFQNSYSRATFDISALTFSVNDYNSILEDVGNGWIRFSAALLANTDSTNNTSLSSIEPSYVSGSKTWYQFTNNGDSTLPVVYVCGCMVEPTSGTLNSPSSYIPFGKYRASDT